MNSVFYLFPDVFDFFLGMPAEKSLYVEDVANCDDGLNLVLSLVNSDNDSLHGGGVPIMIGILTSSLFQMLLILWKTSMRLKLVLNRVPSFLIHSNAGPVGARDSDEDA